MCVRVCVYVRMCVYVCLSVRVFACMCVSRTFVFSSLHATRGAQILDDFVAELHRFVAIEEEVKRLSGSEQLGSLNLKTDNLKLQLKHEIERWKFQYSEKLHQEAKVRHSL